MKPQDFEQMEWRIDLLKPEQDTLDEYSELNDRFKKFALDSIKLFSDISNDQLVRFIVYAYHKFSPYVKKITEPKHRKTQALVQCGIDVNCDTAKEIIAGDNKQVSEMIFAFLIGENSIKFTTLMQHIDAYYKTNQKIATGEITTTKQVMEGIEKLGASIDNLSHEVFHGEPTLSNFAKSVIDKGLILTPEQNAHRKV